MLRLIFGMNFRQVIPIRGLAKNKAFICCDLTGATFDNRHLERIIYFGCDLSGADFSNSTIKDVRFVHCYSAPTRPLASKDVRSTAISNERSSISAEGGLAPHFVTRWPGAVDAQALRLRSKRNDERYRATQEIAADSQLSEFLYPFLGIALLDPEWEVRDAGLQALVAIRSASDRSAPVDRWMTEWILHSLGDPSPFVRATVRRLLPTIAPGNALLQHVVTASIHEPIARMRACEALLRSDDRYSALIDFEAVRRIASGAAPLEARLSAIDVLQMTSAPQLQRLVVCLASDAEPQIRARAINLIGMASVPGARQLTRSAMRDPDWRVRLQALDTAEEIGCLDPEMIEAALRDPSEKVREFGLARRQR
jgi:hypothetical protein